MCGNLEHHRHLGSRLACPSASVTFRDASCILSQRPHGALALPSPFPHSKLPVTPVLIPFDGNGSLGVNVEFVGSVLARPSPSGIFPLVVLVSSGFGGPSFIFPSAPLPFDWLGGLLADAPCYSHQTVEPHSSSLTPLVIYERRTTAKAFAKDVFINQERKLGARRRLDTVLVSTINDADQGSADVTFRTPPAPYEKSKSLGSGGSMVARLKLKGIDGRAPPRVEPAA
ncbi:hypothetical protein GOBAR_DD19261 [Gossypium barbadense]|nr:hypothetical protein GOBAR_DD19261 [Gossypium barbadense]